MAAGNNTYTTQGNFTWTCPAGVTSVKVELWGGGGGGAGGNATVASAAGGGGAFAQLTNYVTVPGANYNISVGNGGAGGGANANGTNGNITVFRHSNNANAAYAAPGARGTRTSNANSAGGTTGASSGNTTYAGGNGAGRNNSTATQPGSGGGAAGDTGAGTAGTNGVNAAGGAGGGSTNKGGNGGGANLATNGGAGIQPGGGGAGGGNTNKSGGVGGVGKVVISWTQQYWSGNANVGVGVECDDFEIASFVESLNVGIGVGIGATETVTSSVANDFSTDSNCVALYNFESGALTTDSKSTNTLTDVNTVTADTTNFKQGTASANFEYDSTQAFFRPDSDLTSGFPLKSDDTNKNISVCAWFRLESLHATLGRHLLSKMNTNQYSLRMGVWTTGYFYVNLGFNSGTEEEGINHASTLSLATWYHVTFTYKNSDKSYALRIRDSSGNAVGSDVTGTATLDANKLSINAQDFMVGTAAWNDVAIQMWDGLIDEFAVFKDILTETESTNIAKGLYAGPVNDFSTDSNCVALYNFENGALTTDSKGTNTLTDVNTVLAELEVGNYRQGKASAYFHIPNQECLYITDSNLAAGFPLKNGDTTKNISVCAWIYGYWNADNNIRQIFCKLGKASGSDVTNSFQVRVHKDDGSGDARKLTLILGYNGGLSEEEILHGTQLSSDTWYHITATYQNSDKSYALRIRDINYNVVGSDVTGTATLDANKLNVADGQLTIGAAYYDGTYSQWWEDLIDELVVFKDILTEAESTNIAKGLYAGGAGTYTKTASVGIGLQAGDTEIMNLFRSLGVGVGIGISDSEKMTFPRTANVGVGLAITDSEKMNFPRTAPVGIGINVADSEKMTFPRLAGVGIELAVTDSETRNLFSTVPVGIGVNINPTEKADFKRTVPIGVGIASTDSEVRGVPSISSVGIGVQTQDSETRNISGASNVGVGVNIIDSEKANFNRIANVGAGISITTTETAIFIELASVGISIAVTPSSTKTGVNIWLKTASVSMNFQVTDAEAASFLRTLGVGIGATITSTETRNVPSTAPVGIGVNINPTEKADFKRTVPVGVNVQTQDSEVANFPETSSVGVGINITDSETRNVPSTSNVGVNVAVTDSEKAAFNRLAAVQMGMNTGDQEKANFPESNSVTITITSTITGSVGGIKISAVGVGIGPSVTEIATFIRSLLPNVAIQIGVTETRDIPKTVPVGVGVNISAAEKAAFTRSLSVTANMQTVVSKIATLVRTLNPNVSIQTAVAEVANFRKAMGVGVGVGVSSTALRPEGKFVTAFLNLLIATSAVSFNERPFAFKVAFEGFNAVFDFNPDEVGFTILKDCEFQFTERIVTFKMERKKFFDLN
jgi:hypothetical protein